MMTKEDAKRILQDMWECLFNEMTNHTFEDLKEHGMLDNYSTAFNMAISALSTDDEYIKKKDAIEYLNDLFGEMYLVSFDDVVQSIDSLQTYSFPDIEKIRAEIGNEIKFWKHPRNPQIDEIRKGHEVNVACYEHCLEIINKHIGEGSKE